MSDLAYNINGESFELPATASGWRVRRMKQRGAPEVVYGRDGVPLVIPIESNLDELRHNIDAPGRFRLDAVDERGRSIEDVPAAYVQVASLNEAAAPGAPPTTPIAHHGSDSIVAEAMRLNTELAKSIIDRFPEMMAAAAELLRAADGAGLPARAPRLLELGDDHEDEQEDTIEPPGGFDLNALVAQVVPVLVTGLMSGKVKLPGLAALFDWRKAAPANDGGERDDSAAKQNPAKKKRPIVQETPVDTTQTETPEDTAPDQEQMSTGLPPLDPSTMAHFIAIQSELTPEESTLAREVASQLSPAELRGWFDELGELSVADAAEKIRKVVSGAKAGGAS